MLICKLFGLLALLLMAKSCSSTARPKSRAVKTAESSMINLGLIFSLAQQGLQSYDKDKYPKLELLSRKTGRLAGLLGVFGAFFSIVMTFLPNEKSEELKYMESEFEKLGEKVDTIARSLNDTKGLIESKTQQAAYVEYERNINHGFAQLKVCLKKLNSVNCNNRTDCKRKRETIAQGYISSLNVRKDIDSILRGATSDSVFGRSLLVLLQEESKCDVPKTNLLANKIVSLATEGIISSIFYNILTYTDYNVLDDIRYIEKMLRRLENKRQTIEDYCFKEIDYWLSLDVRDASTTFSSDIQNTNTAILQKCKKKYPWSDIHVFTSAGDKEPTVGPTKSNRRHFWSYSETHKVHAFVVPTNNATVVDMEEKIEEWKELLELIDFSDDLDDQVKDIERKIRENSTLDGEIQSFAILPGDKWVLGHYANEIKQHTLGADNVTSMNVFVNRPRPSEDFLVVVSFRPADFPFKCTDTCHGHGHCYTYPYSRQTGCRCNKGYSGHTCETSTTNQQLQSVISSLLKNTIKLPTFASIQHTIEDVQMSLAASLENIQESITYLESIITTQLRNLGLFVSNRFELLDVMLKYENALESVHYYHVISNTKDESLILDLPRDGNSTFKAPISYSHDNIFARKEEKDMYTYLLNPTGIQKWMYQINNMIIGRRDNQFNSHKSIIFLIMDKYKDSLCSENYKDAITRTYRHLMLLQLRGYLLWGKAIDSVSWGSSELQRRYEVILQKQKKFIQEDTCSVNIPFSTNLQNCTCDGYINYMHKSLEARVVCDAGYFVKGM